MPTTAIVTRASAATGSTAQPLIRPGVPTHMMRFGTELRLAGEHVAVATHIGLPSDGVLLISTKAPSLGLELESTYVGRDRVGLAAVHFATAGDQTQMHTREHAPAFPSSPAGQQSCLSDHLRFVRGIAQSATGLGAEVAIS